MFNFSGNVFAKRLERKPLTTEKQFVLQIGFKVLYFEFRVSQFL